MLNHRSHQLAGLASALATTLAFAGAAHAERPAALDRVGIWLGGYGMDYDATADIENLPGGLSVKDQKVLEGNKVVKRARIDWLIMDRQGFSLDYYQLRNKGGNAIRQPITANGTTYDIGGEARHDTKLEVGNFSYRWWLGEDANLFGIGVGAQHYALSTTISARASVGPLGTYDYITKESASGWAPLLTLGWRTQINEQWRVYADASGARYSNGDERGSIVNAAVGVEYFPWKNVGVGAEYGIARIRYKRTDDDYTARLNVKFDGPAVFLRLRY